MWRYLVNFDFGEIKKSFSDVVVVGSGIAGLTAALEASKDFEVTLVTKRELKETATWYAQGGVASAATREDSPQLHFRDTLAAGAGLCDPAAVKVLVADGPDSIGHLINLGTDFDWLEDRLSLTREGGHSLARIFHSGDSTGNEIQATLVKAAKTWRSVRLKEQTFLVDLLTDEKKCVGILTFDSKTARLTAHLAPATVLATGGAGQLYSVTTNPSISTGDGMATAYRAGAKLVDMEFIQFHPTALDERESPRFLITEALRGEGAFLRDEQNRRFMVGVHPLAELAPRDVVVREMMRVMRKSGTDHVYLDATHISAQKLRERFPSIWQRCKESGYDLSTDLIPVSPAAHYTIGGVWTDTNGQTSLPGLYASGEVACVGVHGANRLASNSLLEGLVFSRRVCRLLKRELPSLNYKYLRKLKLSYQAPREKTEMDVEVKRAKLQKVMSEKVGTVRSGVSLKQTQRQLKSMEKILEIGFDDTRGFELQNLIIVAERVVEAALQRRESRGCHLRDDFPEGDDEKWKKRIYHQLKEVNSEVKSTRI